MKKTDFNNEKEIQDYVEGNIEIFFGKVIFLPGDFFIFTPNDKKAKPDGFIIDLDNYSWSILETERIEHGVWDHIGEQLMRFIVASKNIKSQRIIRDKCFEKLKNEDLILFYSKKLKIAESELLREIEMILENESANITVVIDDVIDDFSDCLEALNATVEVFVVDKFEVNGEIEYYLRTKDNSPVIQTTVDTVGANKGRYTPALNLLGDYVGSSNVGQIKYYKYENGDKVRLIFSKDYPDNKPFWYGITNTALKSFKQEGLTHVVFILGVTEGIVKVPLHILEKYFETAKVSKNPDGSIKHWHVLITSGEKHILYTNKATKEYDLDPYFISFN